MLTVSKEGMTVRYPTDLGDAANPKIKKLKSELKFHHHAYDKCNGSIIFNFEKCIVGVLILGEGFNHLIIL